MKFVPHLKVSSSNHECLISVVSSAGGSFTPKGQDNPVSYTDGYKVSVLRVGKTPVNLRLTVDDMALLCSVLDTFQDSLGE